MRFCRKISFVAIYSLLDVPFSAIHGDEWLGRVSAPKVPFSHINIGSLKKKRDSGPFRGSSGRNAFRETAENGQRPLGETALPSRLCTNLKNPKG